MGSLISLGVGELELSWGRNNFFNNYSQLFLPRDKKDIPYYYADNIVKYRPGFSRKLKDVRQRLDLLGYSLKTLPTHFQAHLDSYPSYLDEIDLSFEAFSNVFQNIKIGQYRNKLEDADYDPGEYAMENIIRNEVFAELRNHIDANSDDVASFFENFDPLVILRLLMENPANLELELEWRTEDVLAGGWVTEDELYTGLSDSQRFLIITEGSSDLYVIKRSLEILRPGIIDFFSFIDMQENYPFTGTGNLFRFCQGLATIKIQNKGLVIFDNDAEGFETHKKTKALNLPNSLKIMKLPCLEEFKAFRTIGPSGEHIEDVNERAISIECFLDLKFKNSMEPRIRWTNYHSPTQSYHGALENKDDYIRRFRDIKNKSTNYDFSKLEILVENIVVACTS